MQQLKNIKITGFKNIHTINNPKVSNLFSFLTCTSYQGTQNKIRSLDNEEDQKKLKQSIPTFCLSGEFSSRTENGLISHNGYVAFDIDLKDNTSLFKTNTTKALKQLVGGLDYVYTIAESLRGGLWGMVKIKDREKHREHYLALIEDFAKIGIKLDTNCINVSRSRYVSYDPEPYINRNATTYTRLPKVRKERILLPRKATTSTEELFLRCLSQIEVNHIDITGASRFDWLKVASAIASEFGAGGLEYFQRVSCYYPNYNPKECEKTFNHIAKNPKCTISSFFSTCKRYNITYLQ